MSEAPAKRAKLAVQGVNGSSPGGAGAQVSSPRRAARAAVDTDAELLEADAAANGDAPVITDAMAAENAKCDTPSHHRAHQTSRSLRSIRAPEKSHRLFSPPQVPKAD